jgi:hypothetical protein
MDSSGAEARNFLATNAGAEAPTPVAVTSGKSDPRAQAGMPVPQKSELKLRPPLPLHRERGPQEPAEMPALQRHVGYAPCPEGHLA